MKKILQTMFIQALQGKVRKSNFQQDKSINLTRAYRKKALNLIKKERFEAVSSVSIQSSNAKDEKRSDIGILAVCWNSQILDELAILG